MFFSLSLGNYRSTRKRITALALAAISSLWMTAAYTATWPEKNISVVVPFSAGGVTDMIGRLLADGLSKQYPDTSVVVENIPGGASIPAVASVLNGSDNGNKILMATETPLFINKYSYKNQRYNPDTDLASVTMLYRTPHSLSVKSNSRFKSFDDFVTEIKNNPGEVAIGVNVIGGSAHLALERWKKANALVFEIIPYSGGGTQAINDLIGGHIDAHVDVLGNAIPFAKDQKTEVLAVLQSTKIPDLPDAKLQDESDPKDLTVASVLILTVSSQTSAETVDKIHAAIKKVAEDKRFIERMEERYFDLVMSTPEEATKLREEHSLLYKDMFEASGLQQN